MTHSGMNIELEIRDFDPDCELSRKIAKQMGIEGEITKDDVRAWVFQAIVTADRELPELGPVFTGCEHEPDWTTASVVRGYGKTCLNVACTKCHKTGTIHVVIEGIDDKDVEWDT